MNIRFSNTRLVCVATNLTVFEDDTRVGNVFARVPITNPNPHRTIGNA